MKKYAGWLELLLILEIGQAQVWQVRRKLAKLRAMKRIVYLMLLITIAGCSSSAKKAGEKSVQVFCASSLTNVMQEILDEYSKESKVQYRLNAASSGTLARQIEEGADAAVFVSASKNWVDYLSGKNLTVVSSEKRLAGNSLAIVVPFDSSIDTVIFNRQLHFPDIFQGRLSIGDPAYVPAGAYAKQALENMGCFAELSHRLLPAKDVRSALMVVELGEAEAGIVFKTDALESAKVKLVAVIPDEFHDPVEYYSSVITGHQNPETLAFYRFLFSDKAKQIWIKNGFKP